MSPRILSSRDYFSDRTFGDIMVQAGQIKGMRSQRARMPQEQRMRDMQEAGLVRQAEEARGRSDAYASAYGGDPSAGYEAEAMQGMRKRKIAALGQMFGLIDNISKSHGVEGANMLAAELYKTSPELQEYFPDGPPEVEKVEGDAIYMNMITPNEVKDVSGNVIPAGTKVRFKIVGGKPVAVMGVVDAPKAKKPEMSEKQARAKKAEIEGKLHTMRSNPMSYSGDPAKYEKALLEELAYAKQFIPEEEPAPGQLTGGDIVRTGVDNATGKRVVQYQDGTIVHAP